MSKNTLIELRQLIKSYIVQALREAEEEEAPTEDAAADAGEEPAGEDAPTGGGEEAAGEEGEEQEAKPQQQTGPEISFNVGAVKKYNDALFRSNKGFVQKIGKDGMEVKVMPDDVDIFVTFDDVTESAKKFFKKK